MHVIELDYTSDTSRNDIISYIKCEIYKIVKEVEMPKDWPLDVNMNLWSDLVLPQEDFLYGPPQ